MIGRYLFYYVFLFVFVFGGLVGGGGGHDRGVVVYDLRYAAYAESYGAGVKEFVCGFAVAYAAGCLYLALALYGVEHKLDVVYGGTAVSHAGGGLYKVCAGSYGTFAGEYLFGIVEIAGLDDDLNACLWLYGVNYRLDVVVNEFGVACAQVTDIDYHIYLIGAVLNCLNCFGDLDAGFVCAQGEADNAGGLNAGAYQLIVNEGNVDGVYAYGASLIFDCFGAEFSDLLGSGVCTQTGVVAVCGIRWINAVF